MPRTAKDKYPAAKATDMAKKALKDAKDKLAKNPNNETLKKAVEHAKKTAHETAKTLNRERFLNVGAARTGKVLKALTMLCNVTNPHSYEFTREEVEKIMTAIEAEVASLHVSFDRAFNGPPSKEKSTGFSFQ